MFSFFGTIDKRVKAAEERVKAAEERAKAAEERIKIIEDIKKETLNELTSNVLKLMKRIVDLEVRLGIAEYNAEYNVGI